MEGVQGRFMIMLTVSKDEAQLLIGALEMVYQIGVDTLGYTQKESDIALGLIEKIQEEADELDFDDHGR